MFKGAFMFSGNIHIEDRKDVPLVVPLQEQGEL